MKESQQFGGKYYEFNTRQDCKRARQCWCSSLMGTEDFENWMIDNGIKFNVI